MIKNCESLPLFRYSSKIYCWKCCQNRCQTLSTLYLLLL
ncbi:hypothetical protein OIU79_018542 [Salix purpurea]|uniref:Uncharacterized protein n=1 Tax=Salix purpurea TaxID=77065 RepID=A0A9Q0WYH4_SALPP|nr:hypothetical protein OIU79_018542 [Salix purpurea]